MWEKGGNSPGTSTAGPATGVHRAFLLCPDFLESSA